MNSLTTPSRLVIENLSKKFGTHLAVNQASWSAEHSEIICLLGHSGCGKTTMLRLIAGLESPTQGSIVLAEKTLYDQEQNIPPESRNIGLVFQDYALFPHLSIRENIKFGLTAFNKHTQNTITDDVLAHVSLSEHADKYPHMLSGGEQQRVALARALAPKPEVLLMDEPFSNLDRRLRDRIRKNTIDILRQVGTTTIIVTHDPEEALQIADKIILMHQGKIIQIGTPQQLFEQPNSLFAAEYFSTLNKIPCSIDQEQLKSHCSHFSHDLDQLDEFDVALKNHIFYYCFRPYQVELSLEAQEDSIPVTVVSINYLGHQQTYELQINHSDQIIHAQGVFDFIAKIDQQLFAQIQGKIFIFPADAKTQNTDSSVLIIK